MIDIKSNTAALVRDNLGLSEDTTQALFDIGLLDEGTCKKVLIREEYLEKSLTRRKTDLKIYLADKYCVSFASVEKYVRGI